jgi:hypothetical protein
MNSYCVIALRLPACFQKLCIQDVVEAKRYRGIIAAGLRVALVVREILLEGTAMNTTTLVIVAFFAVAVIVAIANRDLDFEPESSHQRTALKVRA